MLPRNSCVGIRPCNCDSELGTTAKCPNCKQFHLRPGYCQALDPINAAKYPQFHPDKRDEVPVRHRAETTQVSVTRKDKTVTQQQIVEKVRNLEESNQEKIHNHELRSFPSVEVAEMETRLCVECGNSFLPKRANSRKCPDCQ